jgi:hypothetical protein
MTIGNIELLRDALKAEGARIFIATASEDGTPHLEENARIRIDEDGRLELLELDEYSLTNRNLVRSIWFSKNVTVLVRAGETAVKTVGKPYKAIITGPRFEAHYRAIQEESADAELSTVWLIDIEAVSDERPEARRKRDNEGRLPLTHLDRIAKKSA